MPSEKENSVKQARLQVEEAVKSALKITDPTLRIIMLQSVGSLAAAYGFTDLAQTIASEVSAEQLRKGTAEEAAYNNQAAFQQQAQPENNLGADKQTFNLILDAALSMLTSVSDETKKDIAQKGQQFYNTITDENGKLKGEMKAIEKLSNPTQDNIPQVITAAEIKEAVNFLQDKEKRAEPVNAAEQFDKAISNGISEIRMTPEGDKTKYTDLDPERKAQVDAIEVTRAPAAKLMVAANSADLKEEFQQHVSQFKDLNEKETGVDTSSFAAKFFEARKQQQAAKEQSGQER